MIVAKVQPDLSAASSAIAPLQRPEPWPEPVDGKVLLDEIARTIKRYVMVPHEAADAAALWILKAYSHDTWDVSPILRITSPTKRCGKTKLLDTLAALVPQPLQVSNLSAAVLYRAVEGLKPTLLIDETDSFLDQQSLLRNILNSGYTRRGLILRCAPKTHAVQSFSAWCPKVLAGIGRLADTIEDRSITLKLRRRKQNEHVERLRQGRIADELLPLRQQCVRWVQDHQSKLLNADPNIPEGLTDRQADNWFALLAIADCCGGEWPERARRAATAISQSDPTDETDYPVLLLSDIREVFAEAESGKISSENLIAALAEREDGPWGEWQNSTTISPRQVAGLLRGFGIAPTTIRIGSRTLKGYEYSQFLEAWASYLPPEQSVAEQPTHTQRSDTTEAVAEPDVSDVAHASGSTHTAPFNGTRVSENQQERPTRQARKFQVE